MIYVAANVFIYAATDAGARGKAAAAALRIALAEGAVTATLTIDEFLWALRKKLDRPTTAEKARQLMTLPLQVASVLREDAEDAIVLFEKGLDPRDAIHAAVARRTGSTKIVSSDPAFDKVVGLKRTDY